MSIEAKKRKAERIRKRKLISELGRLEETHCQGCELRSKTIVTNPATVCGGCNIYAQIRTIGNELAPNADIQVGRPKEPAASKGTMESLITVEEYYTLKDQGMLDKDIADSLKSSVDRLTRWKSRNNVDTRNQSYEPKAKPKEGEPELAKLTVETYKSLRKQGLKDKEIAKRVGMTLTTVYQFKSTNGLSNKRKPLNASQSTNKTVSKDKEVKSMPVFDTDFKIQPKTLEIDRVKHSNLEYEIERLKIEVRKQNEKRVKAENDLCDCKVEYRKLDTDLRNEIADNRRVKAMLEKLKETAQMNVWLMKQHVSFMEQLDGATEKGEVDNTWR